MFYIYFQVYRLEVGGFTSSSSLNIKYKICTMYAHKKELEIYLKKAEARTRTRTGRDSNRRQWKSSR